MHLAAQTATFNVPALVRPQLLYIFLQIEQEPVFLVNSRQGYFRCVRLAAEGLIPKLRPLFCLVP